MARGQRNNLPNIGRPRFVQIRDKLRRRPRLFYKISDPLRSYGAQGRTVEEDSSSRKIRPHKIGTKRISTSLPPKKGQCWTKAEFAAYNIDERSLAGIDHVCDDDCPGDDVAEIQAVCDQIRKIHGSNDLTHTRPTDDGSDHYIERKKITLLSLDEGVDDDHMPGKRVPPAILDRVYRHYLSGKGPM